MSKKYVLNTGTGVLHIKGFCCHSKSILSNHRCFNTEEEAYNYAGRGIRPCCLCQKKKEKRLHGERKWKKNL